ncbi:assimilatory sulfite reductase (NADPH) flavoprotein subunit [Alkalimonas collagenimarina]|uniref:Sulfite reductase [NADPH] flavoprotein alpha-component n=1 Tax=Alkalimonas collagenimarina TaxID=400390 RepID=A0ABT9GZ58_9GAMM|nr:assimilatory sulfite reductase (NADPH) flavoprotein subunit [Alkalimonas collagenimarina]MDP4535975.1 assimilatory sulfite reductase (NADPH) flavoprotein subunit [Alkalimonas collagenimarina]
MLLSSLVAQASPLTEQQIQQLQGVVSQLNPIQQAWVSGYLAASAQLAGGSAPQAAASAAPASSLTILYGSQTGNARHVAEQLANAAKAKQWAVKVLDMADYKANQLKQERFLTIVTSTYGEGEPPENAEAFYKFLFSKKAPKLNGLKYAVLGLGDTSYEFFCKTAQDFDERLAELGGVSLQQRQDLDVDYEAQAESWNQQLIKALEPELNAASEPAGAQVIAWPGQTASATSTFSKQNPFHAELYANQKITGRDSTKDVRHIEISLEGSDIRYQPGDALGVYFLNDPAIVREILLGAAIASNTPVQLAEHKLTVEEALLEHLELTQSYPAFVEKYAAATRNDALQALAVDKAALRAYLADRQIIDIIRDHPGLLTAQQLVDALRKQQPRLYSIASSQAEVEEEVHLTVAVVRYDAYGQPHLGGASGFLAERLAEGERIKVFVEHNDNFRLPANDDTPVIMVGPGTGIAPFRAFLQEREQRDASGDNWLFFGNPHFTQDFIYQVELQRYLKQGLLSKLDVAFSRDQAEKVYVQDKLRKQGAELFAWLERGAHLYICGDGNRMAKDVHQALLDIIQQHGQRSAEQAETYLDELKQAKRYQKDVY